LQPDHSRETLRQFANRCRPCKLAPYRAGNPGKNTLSARQVSRRGGNLACEVKTGRVILSGSAVTFMEATIVF